MRTVPSARDRGAKKDRSAASTAGQPECRAAAATGPAGKLGGDRVVLALEVDIERDVGHGHGGEPGIEQRAASRVRVGEVERAAVGHLVAGASGLISAASSRASPSGPSAFTDEGTPELWTPDRRTAPPAPSLILPLTSAAPSSVPFSRQPEGDDPRSVCRDHHPARVAPWRRRRSPARHRRRT